MLCQYWLVYTSYKESQKRKARLMAAGQRARGQSESLRAEMEPDR